MVRKKRNRPTIAPARAARIYVDMLWYRRELYDDHTFFKMTDVWKTLCEEFDGFAVKTYKTSEVEDFKRKAGLIAFDGRVTLTADERLMDLASRGCWLSNYMLAHEFGHLGLDHHRTGAIVKNFQLFVGPSGMENIPPTPEELEANYAATFFQCGVALLDLRFSDLELARRAFSDPNYIKKARAIMGAPAFQREVQRLTALPRFVL